MASKEQGLGWDCWKALRAREVSFDFSWNLIKAALVWSSKGWEQPLQLQAGISSHVLAGWAGFTRISPISVPPESVTSSLGVAEDTQGSVICLLLTC